MGSKQTGRSHVDYNIVPQLAPVEPCSMFYLGGKASSSQSACQVPSQDSQCQAMMEPILGLLPQSASMQSDLPAPWGRPNLRT